jgi:PD-(D/E)XK nuclease superfamily
MSEAEGTVGIMVKGLIAEASEATERSLYAAERKIGVSDIGGCREYARRLIVDEPFTDPRDSFMPAFMGTAFGKEFEEAFKRRHPDAETQLSITVPLKVEVVSHDGTQYLQLHLPGHPDIVIGNTVIDGKTKDGLDVVRKEAEKEDGLKQNKFQLTLYAHALIEMGKIDKDATLALVYYDRSGKEEEPFVVEWKFDEAILDEAQRWLSDVFYAVMYESGDGADTRHLKDKPRTFCQSYCPYFTACRGPETDVEGLLEEPDILAAIEVYDEAKRDAAEAERRKKSAAAALTGISGHTVDGLTLRWIHINESVIPSTTRRAHERIDLRRRK